MAHKKPPLGAMMGPQSKKGRKVKNIHTISHDDENNNPNTFGFGMVSNEQ